MPRGTRVLGGRAPNFHGINSMLWRAGKKTKGNSDLVYVRDENIMNYKVS
jgi:hypothetical protein